MLREVWRACRARMVASYLVLAVEAAAFGFLPHFLGKAVDGLFAGSTRTFVVYALVCIGACGVGCLRRVFDTRVFGRAWGKISSGAVREMLGRGMDSAKVVVRAGLSSKFVDFFEFALPQLGRAVVGVSVSVWLLWRSVGLWSISVLVLFLVSVMASIRLSRARRKWDDVAVEADDIRNAAIGDRDIGTVERAYGRKVDSYVASSDLSAFDWIQGIGFGMVAEAIAILAMVRPGVTPGSVLEVVGYVWGVFGHSGGISGFLDAVRGVALAKDKIAEA